ncbi:alanine/glycine:cation symporter family protein [Trichococcus collinsii]|uniref:Alanine or glycine:cation symporter, AGCS family n=1 Tax=Trichococcus collinsii TaxID=157076 RepID=A0AB38A200_9LACT|nr:sodium:alanine symporter family protein [Trichococcus collinsii]CZQ97045.1 sodium:alanine symporter [Trichococcus collinsii]SEA70980.1 alanine or glycine:cation symporter, AGCS family [Trichococcus collinsii]
MEIVKWLNDTIIWGIPMLVLMLGTGVYLTFKTKAVIFTRFGTVMANTLKTVFRKPKEIEAGTITPFQAVCTALAGTVGTGNIVGVAVAISVGGPGAIFWMWTSAVLGMVTKYAETTLALAYREKNAKGEYVGGPMYYISKGLGFPKLAYLFCLLTAFSSIGGGNIVQANAVAGSLKDAVSIPALASGLLLALFVALVVVGGIKRIARVAEKLVPIMALIYTGAAIFILIVQRSQIPSALATIFTDAFTGTAAIGGFTGASLMYAARIGVARGVFTNEAGLGSAPIAHSTANTDHPARQGCWGAFEVFFDTIIMCTITALVIIISGTWKDASIDGVEMSNRAFSAIIPGGEYIVSIGIVLFAFATIIAWYYYSEKAIEYIAGEKAILVYRFFYIGSLVYGAVATLDVVWEISDLFNGLMAIPNLIALIGLVGPIVALTNDFFADPETIRPKEQSYASLIQTKRYFKRFH